MSSTPPAPPAQAPRASVTATMQADRAGSRAGWICALVLVAAAFTAYGNALSAPFVFDDESAVLQNTHLRSLTPLARSLGAPPGTGASGRPLVALSLALNHALGGYDVRGYRLFNVAIHALCALALFGLLRRILQAANRGLPARALSFAISLVWVVHPLCTDAVDLVITRNEQLMALFYLTTLYCALRAFTPGSSRVWYLAAVVACVLGMASKENMVSAPLAVLLLDRYIAPEGRRMGIARTLGEHRAFYASLALSWALLGLLVTTAERGETIGLHAGLTPLSYFLTQAEVIPTYLRLVVWPAPLILDYGDWSAFQGQAGWFPWAVILLLSVFACGWLVMARHGLGLISFVFMAVLAPTSSFIPITGEVAAEHRMYLPLVAAVCGVVLAGHALGARLPLSPGTRRKLATALVVAAVLACATATRNRNSDYGTAEGIWRDTLAKRPHNARAYCGLATELIGQDKLDEAVAQLERSLRVRPSSAESHRLLGVVFTRQGRPTQARSHYRTAARLLPGLPQHIFQISMSALESGDATFAASNLVEALSMRPGFKAAQFELGWIRAAAPRSELRDESVALQIAERLCEAEPTVAHLDLLAAALAGNQRFDEAAVAVQRALDLARKGSQPGLPTVSDMRARHDLYRQDQPYRGHPTRPTLRP